MERSFVEGVRIEGFRCIKAADLRLTPLHALIGPNDSGKSSILRALQRQFGRPARPVLRLDPDSMRHPRALIPAGQTLWFADEKGLGLPALYDSLLSRDIPAFSAIGDRMRALFPTVRALRMHNLDSQQKQLGLTLVDGTEVGPAEMSEGMLYWLAFAIIEHLAPQAMLLIEEPENGLHPARIKEVMKVLREVSQRTQVILATHSPLVINELKADEVTIVTRSAERGTICTPMTATKHFETRSKIYALGELWLSYADGDIERDLVESEEPSAAKAG